MSNGGVHRMFWVATVPTQKASELGRPGIGVVWGLLKFLISYL